MKKTTKIKLIAGVLAAVVPLSSLSACTKSAGKEEMTKPINVEISNDTSILSTLDAVSEHTQKDEFFENLVYDGHTFEQYAKGYEEGRKQGDKQRCVINQKQMAKGLLNYYLVSLYGEENMKNADVSFEKVHGDAPTYWIKITYPTIEKEVVPGGITVEKKVNVTKELCMDWYFSQLVAIANADYSGWKNEDFKNNRFFIDENAPHNIVDYFDYIIRDIDDNMNCLTKCVISEISVDGVFAEPYIDADRAAEYNDLVRSLNN